MYVGLFTRSTLKVKYLLGMVGVTKVIFFPKEQENIIFGG